VVSFVASDALSGVASTTPQTTVTTEGANQTVSGEATDVADNLAMVTATVDLDLSDPVLTVTTPAVGALVRTATVAITGSVSDAVSGVAAVTCNGEPGTVSGGGFRCSVPLEPGRNTVVAEVQDRAGRSAQVQRLVIFQPGPAVTITAPVSLSAFNRTPVAVTGTVSADAVAVACNDVPAGLSNGGFGATVPLDEGNNILTCVARDARGQVGTASTTVTLDTMPPRVTIQTPSNGAVLTSTPITVTGMINDVVVGTVNVEEARVECNGVRAQIANRAFVATPVPLTPGANPIICTGIDRAGNVDTEQITVTVNTAASATITVVSGNNQTARIGTRLSDPLVVALTENGAPASGKPVQFRILRNDGSLSTDSGSGRSLTVMTDATGQAAVRFTLGTWAGAGNNQVEVTAAGFVGETLFSATATPGPPGLIVVDAGNNQEGAIGQELPRPFVATVVDSGSNRLGGVPVTFTVTQGAFRGRVFKRLDASREFLSVCEMAPAAARAQV
jgi:Glucodextranase, domain B